MNTQFASVSWAVSRASSEERIAFLPFRPFYVCALNIFLTPQKRKTVNHCINITGKGILWNTNTIFIFIAIKDIKVNMNSVTYFSDSTPANFTEYSILSAAEAEKGGDQFFHGMYALFIAPSVFEN